MLHSLCAWLVFDIKFSVAALPSILEHLSSSLRPALHRHAMATSTALQAFMQAPREQRVTALRSLGAAKMAQLEAELREARLTLFGPMPSSKAGQSTASAGQHNANEAMPCTATSPQGGAYPPHRQRTPRPPGAPPHATAPRTVNAKPPAAPATLHRNAQPRLALLMAAQQRPCKPGHWHNKQGKGKGPVWADVV